MQKFLHALEGLKEGIKDKSIKLQLLLGTFAVIGGLIIKLDHYEWMVFIVCIGQVIAIEFVNSVIEMLCDLYSTEYNEKIKKIKDMTSAAVLVVSFASFIICVLCLIRRI